MRLATLTLLVLALLPAGLHAQVVEETELPRDAAEAAVELFNAPGTIRLRGRMEIPPGRTVEGDVAVLAGPVEIGGTVAGALLVVNGDLRVLPGARVRGPVTVVGGEVEAAPGTVSGEITVYRESLRYSTRDDRIHIDEPERGERGLEVGARTRLSVRVESSYNRVEGLPVRFGPVLESRSRNYTRVDALGIWRTDRGLNLDTDEMGWFLRAEQHLAGRFAVGLSASSRVDPIERWHLRDVEASLAAFLFHKDYRDHVQREGWTAFLRWEDVFSGVRLSLEYRDEDQAYAPVGSPWTIRSNNAPWRPQPLVGEGRLRSLAADVRVDARDDPDDPSDGWHLELAAEAGVGGGLTLPGFFDARGSVVDRVADATELGSSFSQGFLDLRRYARLGPSSRVRLRGVLAGSLDGDPLPPQLQRALGGEGTLPGHTLFAADCGARSRPYSVRREVDGDVTLTEVFPAYGCDRVALFQVEYRRDFELGWDLGPDDDWGEGWEWYPVVDFSPSLTVFFDAGRGWSMNDEGAAPWRQDTRTLLDAGLGVYLGDLGLYWAWPLRDGDATPNFYLRIDHRF